MRARHPRGNDLRISHAHSLSPTDPYSPHPSLQISISGVRGTSVTVTVGTFGALESAVVTSPPSSALFVGDEEPNGQKILLIEPRTLLRFSRVGLFGDGCSVVGATVSAGASVVTTFEGSVLGTDGVSEGAGASGSEATTSTIFCFEDSTAGVGGGR
jgi:hypothetical protein